MKVGKEEDEEKDMELMKFVLFILCLNFQRKVKQI